MREKNAILVVLAVLVVAMTLFTINPYPTEITGFSVYSSDETPVEETTATPSSDSGVGGCPPTYNCGEWNVCSSEYGQTRFCQNTICKFLNKTEERSCVYETPASAPIVEKVQEEKINYFAEYDKKIIDTATTIVLLVLAGVVLLGIRYAMHHEHKKHIKFKPVHRRYNPLGK